jgi:peptidase M28-like protein
MVRQGVVGGLIATVLLFGLAALFWFAQENWVARPAVLSAAAPPGVFSAGRAEDVLARILGPEKPHPVSTEENAAVRGRILKELAALGVPATVHHGFGCNEVRSFGVITCASVNDILGEVKPGEGKAIVMMAHYDSVPAGPGAADDESGVATVLETIRALKARGIDSQHPILALLTDGEEAGLLGAAAFLHDPALRARVGAVINVEARGNRGRSLLFQTSPGDGPLIDLYAANVSNYATSSAYAEIYRLLPNDTDLTLFIRDGFPSFNFAFSENVAHYHTVLDRRENLDPQTLQQHGDNLLGLAGALEQTDFASLSGHNDIYVDLLGRELPRAPAQWALPLSIVAFVLLLIATLRARGEPIGAARWCAAFAIFPALVVGAGAMGWLLHTIAATVSHMPDPSYAYPAALREGLAFGVAFVTLLVSRIAPLRAAAAAVWVWIAALGLVVALLVPGLTPYFLIPALVAGALMLAAAFLPGSWEGAAGQGALLLSALPMLLLWVGFGAAGETVMGLKLHPLFTIPIAAGISSLVPLFAAHAMPRGAWLTVCSLLLVAAVGASVAAGLQPSYSAIAPQRLSISYVQDSGRSLWAVDALAPVPPSMSAAANFSAAPEKISPFAWSSSYVAPADNLNLPMPTARLLANRRTDGGRRVILALQGSDDANQMAFIITHPKGLKAIDIKDWHFDAPPAWAKLDRVVVACMSRDCATAILALTMADDAPVDAILGEDRFGLPPEGARLLAARPKTAVQSQNGDGVLLISRLHVPGA